MTEPRATGDARFYLIYALTEGLLITLAVLAYFFWHGNVILLAGSIVTIALVGSTFLLPRVLMPKPGPPPRE